MCEEEAVKRLKWQMVIAHPRKKMEQMMMIIRMLMRSRSSSSRGAKKPPANVNARYQFMGLSVEEQQPNYFCPIALSVEGRSSRR